MSYYSKDKFDKSLDEFGEVGRVELISYPIVEVNGLPSAFSQEVVIFENGMLGQVTAAKKDSVEVLLFSTDPVTAGTRVARTGSTLHIPVGDKLLGKTIDSLGHSLYPSKPVGDIDNFRPIESESPGIEKRSKINKPLETGVSVVDMLVPLGMGQRELVVGDRKTGKTNFLLQTILNQANKGTICIYVGIGKKKAEILNVEDYVEKNNIKDKTIIVASSSTDSAGIIYLTPYTGMTIAEYFRDQGKDVLIILDDLSTHAKYYREIALLGRNFPGRNAYPGDIFYTHGRLVERAGNFVMEEGGKEVSITCLPVAETIGGDISGYIQTNLMSMTDGHIYFDSDLFVQGRRPAVNTFLSVTRVGRQTQTPVRSGINREISNFLSLYEKTQSFVHFGAELSRGAKSTLAMGGKIIDFFNQPPDRILDYYLQEMLFCLIWIRTWAGKSTEEVRIELEKIMHTYKKSKVLQNTFKKYVSEAADFNELLGKVSAESKQILQTITQEINIHLKPEGKKDK